MMRQAALVLVGLLVVMTVVLVAGCPRSQTPEAPLGEAPPAAVTGELRVLVPCGMIIPLKAAFTAFETAHPGVKITGVYDNPGVLVEKLIGGTETGDVLVTPGSTEMNRLAEKDLVAEDSRQAVGTFELVILVPTNSKLQIKSPADLRKCKTIAAPDPDINSVGASGREALQKLGLWDELKPKMVLTKHAIQAYTMVASGKAEAALAYRNCPLDTNPEKLSKSKVTVACEMPADSYTPQQCLLAVLKQATNAVAAREFVNYLVSLEGRQLLSQNGLTGCLDLAACPVPTSETKATGKTAAVTVIAYYPGNEAHEGIKKLVVGLAEKYPGQVKSEFVDFTSDEGFKRWQAAGLSCGAILINDQQTWSYEKEGKPVEVTFKMAQDGEWTEAELHAVIKKLIAEKKP